MKKFSFFLIILVGLAFWTACSKSLENKLRGTWVVENTRLPQYPKPSDSTYWHFEGGTLAIRYVLLNRTDTASYTFKRKGTSRYLVISCDKDSPALFGSGTKDWFVVRLKKDQLRLAYGIVDDEGRQRGLEQYDLIRIGD
ncbi:MAG: hypothetical protein NZM15_08365 [Flavobacteriales bacterium]|nr:hypothetical protein [Flavobacteriales bacterium]MDW8432699.1 hypothetical protein [Flavobacteriales bacterium]